MLVDELFVEMLKHGWIKRVQQIMQSDKGLRISFAGGLDR